MGVKNENTRIPICYRFIAYLKKNSANLMIFEMETSKNLVFVIRFAFYFFRDVVFRILANNSSASCYSKYILVFVPRYLASNRGPNLQIRMSDHHYLDLAYDGLLLL